MHKIKLLNLMLLVVMMFFFRGTSYALDFDSPFIKYGASYERIDPMDAKDSQDPADAMDSNDPEDPPDKIESLSQDTPDTDERIIVHQVVDPDSAEPKKYKRKYYLGIHNELSVVGSDLIQETPFFGAQFALGYSYEKFFYEFSTAYAMAFLTGASLGVIYGYSEYDDKTFSIDEPCLDMRLKLFISTPITVESMLDFAFWNFLYDFGFDVDWFFWEYKKRSNEFHEDSDYWYGLKPAVYGVFGVGNSFNLFNHRIEYVIRSSYALFGYHIGKKREFRSGVVTNVWF